jgi:hypothetical protein
MWREVATIPNSLASKPSRKSMDKYYNLLQIFEYSLDDFLEDQDIDFVDVVAALDQVGLIDVDDLLIRLRYGYEEDEEAFD